MKLDPKTLIGAIDKAIRMRAKAMHMSIRRRNTAVAHGDGDLVQRLW